jgi:hypothetical protein
LSHTENNVLYTGNMTEADAVLALAGYLEGWGIKIPAFIFEKKDIFVCLR